MTKPMLQIAMDNLSLDDALDTLKDVGDVVDIIEVGTILLCADGKKCVTTIKDKYPSKIVLADGKIADAGNILGKMLVDAKADIVTVICCADLPTVTGVLKVAKDQGKDMQIELTGTWSFEQAEQWKKAGVEQVVYHRSRDSQAAGVQWGEADLSKIKKLCDMGFKVTITGGVSKDDLDLFKEFPIYIIIAGRAIRDAENPRVAAEEFQRLLAEKWS